MPNKPAKDSTKTSTEISPEVLEELINTLVSSIIIKTGGKSRTCWYSDYKPNGRGHIQVKHKNIKYLGHRIMAFSKSRPYRYIPYDPITKIEVSHLCGDSKCLNPDHLALENCLVNQTRDCCRMFGQKKGYKCPHDPVCIGCISIK